jgi:NAD(P) transhydrogenase subunit alpha
LLFSRQGFGEIIPIEERESMSSRLLVLSGLLATAAPQPAGGAAPSMDYTSMLFVFMLATFIGMEVIRRVSRLLHTPLMSLTNAISAIAVVGSIIIAGGNHPTYINILGAVALAASVTNIVSGFLITDRMLKMFKKREPPRP